MSTKKTAAGKTSVAPNWNGQLKKIGGSQSDDWNNTLADQASRTLWLKHSDSDTQTRQCDAMIAGLVGIGPKDEIEGMIAAQLLAAHNAAMECYRRALISEQPLEWWRESLNQANKLCRTYAVLLDALNRHRGKGQQKVTVEHVHVHAGGQAVVGMVEAQGRGDELTSEDQRHAEYVAHAPESAMRRADEEREPMPIASDGERALPDARRNVPGRPQK